jgi:hypothetical protein
LGESTGRKVRIILHNSPPTYNFLPMFMRLSLTTFYLDV